MTSIDIAGIAITALFIIFILSRKKLRKTDVLLVLINLSIIALLVVNSMFQRRLSAFAFLLLNIIPLLFYPIFLIYALEVLREKVHHRGRWVILFLPALISAVYIGSDLFILHHYDQAQLEQLYNYPTLAYHLLSKGFPILFLLALVWLIKRLKKYEADIKEKYSFIDPIELRWLTRSTWIYIFITILSLVGVLIAQLQILPITSHGVCSVVGIFMFFAVFYVSFHGIKQYNIADYYSEKAPSTDVIDKESAAASEIPDSDALTMNPGAQATNSDALTADPDAPATMPSAAITDPSASLKYRTSALGDSEQRLIFEKVVRLFEEKKIYQEPKLQLSDVANSLKVSTHILSQTINTSAGKHFYDFVNGYRVRHLQKLLEDPAQQKSTILSLGFESGFNSKASLNRVFRQDTGLSPSEYADRHRFR